MISYSQQIISEMGKISDEVYDNDPAGVRYFKENPEEMLVGTIFGTTSYTVLDYIDTPITDMQALLLQKTGADEYVIAFRGTQETMDMVVDAIIGINNFNPQFSEARDFVQDMMNTHNISPEHLTLTGHSLGGILTQSVGAVLGIKGYAFNPYGVSRLLTTWPQYRPSLAAALAQVGLYRILEGLGLSTSYADWAEENILNISYNDFGTLNGDPLSNLATALTSDHIGSYLAVFGEDESGGDGHRISVLNRAISQYNAVLFHFEPETTYADLSRVYAHGGNDGYSRINTVFDELGVPDAAQHSLRLNLLFETTSSSLQSRASNPAGMYALQHLLPFTITGADYSHLNQNGELDSANYSDHYLEDRAAFLYQVMHGDAASTTGDDMQFYDATLGIEAYAGNGTPDLSDRHYIFGNLEGELIEGDSKEDHLYGMGGDDTLNGNGGNDILEGGMGSDTMYGGDGDDTFIIHGTDEDPEAFDTFNGGAGTDTIRGGDLDDTIRVDSLTAANSIEVIDGGNRKPEDRSRNTEGFPGRRLECFCPAVV